MAKDEESLPVVVGSCLFLMLSIPVGILLRAWVITKLWGWFLEPYYHIMTPNMPLAVGLMCLAYMMKPNYYISKEQPSTYKMVGSMSLNPLVSLLIGYIALQFIG